MATHFYTADSGEFLAALTLAGVVDEGDCGYVFTVPPGGRVPLYRARNLNTGSHFYTLFIDERDVVTNEEGYKGEGIACYCFAPGAGLADTTQPLYRAYQAATDDHFYTLDETEIGNAPGYVFEGIACHVLRGPFRDAVPLYRFRDSAGLHFYTADPAEAATVGALPNYFAEGTCGYVYREAPAGPAPFYRCHNAGKGSHLYTMDITEHDHAMELGLRGDGIAGYIYPDGPEDANTRNLYRAYNADLDDHFYTIDQGEHQNAIDHLNYSNEGVTGRVLTAAAAGALDSTARFHRLLGDFSGDFLVPPPGPKGLTSNSNYIFNSVIGGSCNPIVGLTVTVAVSDSIVLASNQLAGKPSDIKGFGFQLNAFSMTGFTSAFQQYVIALIDGTLVWSINNYELDTSIYILGGNALTDLGDSTLPAGYQLVISLLSNEQETVTGARFVVIDDSGNTVADTTQLLKDQPGYSKVGAAPIAAFTFDFVGPVVGVQATLEPGGAGTITYAATSPLAASVTGPPCAEALNYFTQETANSVYGRVSASRSLKLTQSFNTGGTTYSAQVPAGRVGISTKMAQWKAPKGQRRESFRPPR